MSVPGRQCGVWRRGRGLTAWCSRRANSPRELREPWRLGGCKPPATRSANTVPFPACRSDRQHDHRRPVPGVPAGRRGGSCPDGVARGVRDRAAIVAPLRRRRPIPHPPAPAGSGIAHSGNGCEWLRLQADGGSSVYIAHDVGRPAVIDDLARERVAKVGSARLAVGRPVVLPRSADPQTGRAVTAIVVGGSYTDTGRWQQLRLEGIPRLLTRRGPPPAHAVRPASR